MFGKLTQISCHAVSLASLDHYKTLACLSGHRGGDPRRPPCRQMSFCSASRSTRRRGGGVGRACRLDKLEPIARIEDNSLDHTRVMVVCLRDERDGLERVIRALPS
jgi:hypothetical protein